MLPLEPFYHNLKSVCFDSVTSCKLQPNRAKEQVIQKYLHFRCSDPPKSISCVGVNWPSPIKQLLQLPSALRPAAKNCDDIPKPRPVTWVVTTPPPIDVTYGLLFEWFKMDIECICDKLYIGECNVWSLTERMVTQKIKKKNRNVQINYHELVRRRLHNRIKI